MKESISMETPTIMVSIEILKSRAWGQGYDKSLIHSVYLITPGILSIQGIHTPPSWGVHARHRHVLTSCLTV